MPAPAAKVEEKKTEAAAKPAEAAAAKKEEEKKPADKPAENAKPEATAPTQEA